MSHAQWDAGWMTWTKVVPVISGLDIGTSVLIEARDPFLTDSPGMLDH